MLRILPVSSLRRLCNGKPTPIFNAAAVGTDIVRLAIICGGGVDESVGAGDEETVFIAATVGKGNGTGFPMLSRLGKFLLALGQRCEIALCSCSISAMRSF